MKIIPLTAASSKGSTVLLAGAARLRLNDAPAIAGDLYPFLSGSKAIKSEALLALLHRSSGKAIKGVRTNRTERFPRNIVSAFLWCTALAGRANMNIEVECWKAYPGMCPYCRIAPCGCDPMNRPPERTQANAHRRMRPKTVREFQDSFAGIYPPLDGLDTVGHFAEELAELHAAFFKTPAVRLSIREHAAFEDPLRVEIVDVFSHLFKISTFMKLDLESALLERREKGCHQCNSGPCTCTPDDFLGDVHK